MATERELDLRLVEKGNNIESGLNSWEMDFIDDMNKWLTKNGVLTPNQREKLTQIIAKKS
jgi:hypothetical protein